MKEQLRMYSFINMYLSSIQQGIQSGHCVDEMTVFYLVKGLCLEEGALFVEWLRDHKTIICCNGGDSDGIESIYRSLEFLCEELHLPYGMFKEPGCANMMTCCNVVVPEQYFSKDAIEHWEMSVGTKSPECIFSTLIKSKSLAR